MIIIILTIMLFTSTIVIGPFSDILAGRYHNSKF